VEEAVKIAVSNAEDNIENSRAEVESFKMAVVGTPDITATADVSESASPSAIMKEPEPTLFTKPGKVRAATNLLTTLFNNTPTRQEFPQA